MDLPLNEEATYEEAMKSLETCIGMLHDQASEVSEQYLSFVDRMEATAKGWQSRSVLQLSCTRKGNHLDLKWTGIKWFGIPSSRNSVRVSIPKSVATSGYTEDKLKVFGKDWEMEEVMKAEQKLQVIRRKARHINKAIISLRNAVRVLKANGSEIEPEVETED